MEERRKNDRITVNSLVIHLKGNETPFGKVVNISERGMMVLSDKPMEEGTAYLFQIPFTKNVPKKVHLDFEAKVIWSKTNQDDPDEWHIGLEYLNYHDLQNQFIRHMIDLHSPED